MHTACTTPPTRRELRELIRVRDLLGLSLQELLAWSNAEKARAGLRARWRSGELDERGRRDVAGEALEHMETQLELVRSRREALEELEDELVDKRRAAARGAHRGGRTGDVTAGGRYKWIALSNTTIGMLMATINSSIVLIALPTSSAASTSTRSSPATPPTCCG